MGKPRDPDYWKKWRAAHPEYREREKTRSATRAIKSRGDRAGQYRRRRLRLLQANGDNGRVETRHAVMDRAATVALAHVRPDRRTHYLDPLYDEALMTAALSILEGSDPHAAVAAVVKAERYHRAVTAPLYADLLEGAAA